MPKNILEERIRWVRMVDDGKVKLKDVLTLFPYSERTLKRWLRAYRISGQNGLVPKSTAPKTQPNETPIRIKERVIELRKKTKLCAKKLHWKLEKQGLSVPVSTIGKILKDEGLVRRYRTKKIKYRYIKVERQPGELVEIDVKYVPGKLKNKRYYQYTAIDTASRWRYLKIYEEQSSYHSIRFLEEVISLFPYRIQAIKTDNHSTFTNYYTGTNKRSDLTVKTLHGLDIFCQQSNIIHYLIDPGKPAQNGKVERSHRSDQETFYDRNTFRTLKELKKKIRIWNEEYNNLEHCGLNGKTPNEMLELKVPNVVS
ncbi:IS481 family transposase [Patescibacteria group bacterium]|nr:IS481 family transposase [Patescibacteria group bacterium]